jgi:transcriptional regulator with GAF, ATPase, and Fis domain
MPELSDAPLDDELARAQRELAEALERQAATDEVLRVISSSPGELKPVFDTILENATRIFAAKFGTMYLCEGDALRMVALHGAPPSYAEERRRNPVIRPRPETMLGRALATGHAIQIADIRDEADYAEPVPGATGAKLASLAGARTVVAVPMLRENELLGAIIIYRQEVRAFTEQQIALVTNFAAQAVIAIENTRLLNELKQRTTDLGEALEQQTATAEVLQVISSSPGELAPVFEAMLGNAVRICEAGFGVLYRYEESTLRPVASLGVPSAMPSTFADAARFDPCPDAPSIGCCRRKRWPIPQTNWRNKIRAPLLRMAARARL